MGDRDEGAAGGVAGSTVTAGESVAGPGSAQRSERPALPGRYEDLGSLARGGFGEVRRVRDTLMDRVLAMKVLHPKVSSSPPLRRRFFTEVQITAQLQHPGIVPVYEHGELRDGRLWYTMKEVRGTTLATILAALHAASSAEGFGTTASGWTFRRVIDAFARIAQTVAYAHSQGVVHRDLKPENVMIGEFGEVLVMDWGLARRVAYGADGGAGLDEESIDDAPAELTRHGEVLGTPAYMPPEQARGARELHGPHSDVYALGAILYHVLTGRPPYRGDALEIVQQLLLAAPPPIEEMARGGPPIPSELARACERAMQREIADRCSAGALATDVVAWLDGSRKREEALRVLAEARLLEPEIARTREAAATARDGARARLGALRPFDPVEAKRPAWQLEDEAARSGRAAALVETRWLQGVHGALSVDPSLPEAHALLAAHYRAALVEAERAHRDEDAARFEELLRAHDRARHAAFLRGEGAVTLVTDPPGAEVALHRHVLSDRRLTEVFERDLGRTPLLGVPVQRGSYLLRIRAPGRAEVRYPVLIERDGHWDGIAPGETSPRPIVLPREGEIGPEEAYVPAGWCWTGGDAATSDSLPGRRLWIEGFVIKQYPVTTGEYLAFLNDLVARGREAEALAACPRAHLGLADSSEERFGFDRDAAGRFTLPRGSHAVKWQIDSPVVLVDWHSARSYSRWFAASAGLPFRLPNELEREKAARGADGRLLPWGDHVDPTFACVVDTSPAEPARESVHGHPKDESPYGVRGLAGNTRDWCMNIWRHEGPTVVDGRLCLDEAAPDDTDFRVIKGGAWASAMTHSRAAARFGARPDVRRLVIGVRLVRSFP